MYAEDTIAAVSTPPGRSGIGIVRLSGPACIAVAAAVFSGSQPAERWRSHHLYHGRIVDIAGAVLDDALAVLMRAPDSYSGEDVLELHCHGSPVVLQRVLARVLACGARLAEPGEFTKRAFLNGRLDLAQAEAVIELIRARSGGAAQLAIRQLSGQLSARLGELRDQLVRLKALLEAQIDFSEEDFELPPAELMAALDSCNTNIESLLNTYVQGAIMRDGARVAIVGKANVGKSSLLNALLGAERAIVTPIAGTTRDTIEETADFDGIPVVLTDTAGLRQMEHGDPIERMGMQRTTGTIAESHLLLTVFDGSAPLDAEDEAVLEASSDLPRVLVLNKIDLGAPVADLSTTAAGAAIVRVSAKERLGLTELRRAVASALTNDVVMEQTGPVLTNIRHHATLGRAADSLRLARESIRDGRPADLVAVDVQDAIDYVGQITGVVTSEDVLDRIFSEFCIGK